ncbi:MAG: DUF1573 domain-containing protein [Desulfobacterales bacterium]|nr:DUF1573 domain-containing protein [Desulfobacterales bacterium]
MIPPGGEGKIKIKVYTNGYGGGELRKTVEVYTNDPKRRRTDLRIKGKVEMFAHFTSRSVVLRGKAGDKIASELVINQRPEYQFNVLNVSARNGRDINYQLEKMVGTTPTVYTLKVENKKSTPGRYFDTIYLQTDSSIHPKIGINVTGIILAAPQS